MLNIQFFGADHFSVRCLRAIMGLPSVSSLRVVTRTLKPSGRGQKSIVDPPIVTFAKEHALDLSFAESQQDFEDLTRAGPPNMAIAVSYGKLIPPAYLQSLRYGGLNVHPSLLPHLKGAAPIHRAIMNRMPYTGVSVQTLDPHKFDAGRVLWQSRHVPINTTTKFPSLYNELADIGAQGLKDVLEHELYVGPASVSTTSSSHDGAAASWARAVKRHEHELEFSASVADTVARANALEKLYFEHPMGKRQGRTLLWDIEPLADGPEEKVALHNDKLALRLADGHVAVAGVQAAGFARETPPEYFGRLRKRKISFS